MNTPTKITTTPADAVSFVDNCRLDHDLGFYIGDPGPDVRMTAEVDMRADDVFALAEAGDGLPDLALRMATLFLAHVTGREGVPSDLAHPELVDLDDCIVEYKGDVRDPRPDLNERYMRVQVDMPAHGTVAVTGRKCSQLGMHEVADAAFVLAMHVLAHERECELPDVLASLDIEELLNASDRDEPAGVSETEPTFTMKVPMERYRQVEAQCCMRQRDHYDYNDLLDPEAERIRIASAAVALELLSRVGVDLQNGPFEDCIWSLDSLELEKSASDRAWREISGDDDHHGRYYFWEMIHVALDPIKTMEEAMLAIELAQMFERRAELTPAVVRAASLVLRGVHSDDVSERLLNRLVVEPEQEAEDKARDAEREAAKIEEFRKEFSDVELKMSA